MSGASATLDRTDAIIDPALRLARSFAAGGRLLVTAPTCADHAHHVAVEFVHPVSAGARALPSLATDPLPRRGHHDVVMAIAHPTDAAAFDADVVIDAGQPDAEIMGTYHLLWELVHIALEHPGLVGDTPAVSDLDSTGFLYPFLDGTETDANPLRTALSIAAAAQQAESTEVIRAALVADDDAIRAAAAAIAEADDIGGRIFVMGNGGSATDAARLVRLLRDRDVDASSLADDYAVITALANDLGAEHVFTRQVEAHARSGDVLVGWSTSGASANLAAAFRRAADRGLVCIGSSGYGGGALDALGTVDHVLRVDSSSVHRIQEAQAALMAAMLDRLAGARVGAS